MSILRIWHDFCLITKLKTCADKTLTQVSAAQLQHLNKRTRYGQVLSRLYLKREFEMALINGFSGVRASYSSVNRIFYT